ncbi:MAG TPA: DMT family transporter [Allosphingosinicella sp.]
MPNAAAPSAHPLHNPLLGILLRAGAATSFAFMSAMIKLGYEAGVNTVELVFYRFAFGLPPLLVWILLSGNYDAWRTARPLAHLSRTAIGLVSMMLAFSALRYLPLAEATTISFAAPLFAVILSALILKEPVGRHRWSAVLVGFAGVMVVMRPGADAFPAIGLIIALGAALGVAAVAITIRQIGRTEGAQTTVLWFTLSALIVVGTIMPFFARAHDMRTWLILAALGLFGGLGQLFMTGSLRYASVSTVVPFDYLQLLWAVLLGWLLWNTHPGAATWAGAAVIIGSGLYTVYREHKLRLEHRKGTAAL